MKRSHTLAAVAAAATQVLGARKSRSLIQFVPRRFPHLGTAISSTPSILIFTKTAGYRHDRQANPL